MADDYLNDQMYLDFEDEDWNKEIADDLVKLNEYKSIVVYSRDWTVQTFYDQIRQKNVDLNPGFQRRNAWNDEKRSKLIESLILGLPVPEIVLAEDPAKKKSFIVIDGKQRLLTIAGFIDPQEIPYWKNGHLTNLQQQDNLNGKTYDDFKKDDNLQDVQREFDNADIRCTVISNYKNTDVLYDIFYRLNTGSVPLSTQELRNVLFKGPFSDYLYSITQTHQPIHDVLRIKGPDPRLIDIELILRFIAFVLFGDRYNGNLKAFLDLAMEVITADWLAWTPKVERTYAAFNGSIIRLSEIFKPENVGRKFTRDKFETRFNRVLFEVQAYYFQFVGATSSAERDNFVEAFKRFCAENTDFRSTIESSTKNISQYKLRYKLYKKFFNDALGLKVDTAPIALD